MRGFLFLLLAILGASCDDDQHSNFYDLGNQMFKHIGESCTPDVAPNSTCGYMPQFYCSSAGVCASACNVDADCNDGSRCVGAANKVAGECRLPPDLVDAGQD